MYQLFAYPNTYSIGAHLLLEEAGAPYRIVDPRTAPSVTDEAFLRASPHGRVPALILPKGTTLCESGAIALHLADSLCDQKYSVVAGSNERGQYLQWLFYLSSTLQPEVMLVFHPEHYFPDNTRQAALVEAAIQRLEKVWTVLNQEYGDRVSRRKDGEPWLFEQGPSAVDFSLATVLSWPECFPLMPQRYPALEAVLQALSERASYQRIMPWHNGLIAESPQRIYPEG